MIKIIVNYENNGKLFQGNDNKIIIKIVNLQLELSN